MTPLSSAYRRLKYDVVSHFFFFQAEDGIRDHCVTGVQTCALPICLSRRRERFLNRVLTLDDDVAEALYSPTRSVRTYSRSEERRVGKECRSRWSPYD